MLDTQIAALTAELASAASPGLPAGLGKLTQVVVSREVCDWQRCKNRRQVRFQPQDPPVAKRLDRPTPPKRKRSPKCLSINEGGTTEAAEGASGGW